MTPCPTFVRVEQCEHGVGKLVDISGEECEVEFFESPVGPTTHRIKVPNSSLSAIELSPETRVFCQDRRSGNWWAGRIQAGPISPEALRQNTAGKTHATEDSYYVRFPNGVDTYVPISNLNVRWNHPIADPTDYLAARITETPFYFDGRTRIVRYLAGQRAAFGGLSGLASSGVELLEHQVATVRRVLADPVERYLLADEVGLGKTIEAGILIRQHIIDHPADARVLVVVPAHLVPQWQQEMSRKFFLEDPNRLCIVSEDELLEIPTPASRVTLLVVDEAHRAAVHAFDPQPQRRVLFERLCALARLAPRVLLLSGTPVRHQEDGFLAMLHLLDPQAYPLEERESFSRRIDERQTIADATADLADDASALFIEQALSSLEHLFGEDSRLAGLCTELRARAPEDVDIPDRVRALRAVRIHLIETYRLHRRLLRTRRDDRRVRMQLPARTGAVVLGYEDPARAEVFDLLEAWRLSLPADVSTRYAPLFASWVESALMHPGVFLRDIDRRLENAGPWAFDSEAELLRTRRTLIANALKEDARAQRLLAWLQESRDVAKAMVFVSDSEIAHQVAEVVAEGIGRAAIALHDGGEDAVERFERHAAVRVLVCDIAAEEGLNLQRLGAAVVHYDLPLAPARIEQRIGRVDRLEARGRLRNVVLSSNQRYEVNWLRCLVDGIRVFHRSIAPLQFPLVEAMARIREQLLSEGSDAFDAESARMLDSKRGLESELRRIRSQEIIDSLEVDSEGEAAFFERLQAADEEAEEVGEQAMNAWLLERLKFVRREAGNGAFRYIHNSRAPTLLPRLEMLQRFWSCIEREIGRRQSTEIPLIATTFQRAVAEKAAVSLLRVGHPIITGFEELVRSDDRGVAFAMWRHVSGFEGAPQLFLRFDFVVETDLRYALEALGSHSISAEAIRRRADDAYPVSYYTVWMDADLQVLEDEALIATLQRPYRKPDASGQRDFNIRLERWERVDQEIPFADWDGLCRRARKAAERHLRQSAAALDAARTCAGRLGAAAARVADALQSRICRLTGASRRAEENMAQLEALLTDGLIRGIESPAIRADSAGVVVLAGRGLFG